MMHLQVCDYNDAHDKNESLDDGESARSLVLNPPLPLTWRTRQKTLAPLRFDGDLPRRQKKEGSSREGDRIRNKAGGSLEAVA